MPNTGAFTRIVALKDARRTTADAQRQDLMDQEIIRLEPELTHDEAVYIVQKYEYEA